MRTGGLFIAFEGGEGSGKSTQIHLLAGALRAAGRKVLVTHEPGATDVGAAIRELLLHRRETLSPRAEALLFAADRAHHVDSLLRPALEAGQVVLTDRYVDSSLAYQGAGRKLTVDEVRGISRWATEGLVPQLTVLLDVPAMIGLARARARTRTRTRGEQGAGDKLESESLAFHDTVRQAFLQLAEADPHRYCVLDATRPKSAIAADIVSVVEALLAQPEPPTRELS